MDATTLEEKVTRGPDTFAVLMPQFKKVSLISEIQSDRLEEDGLKRMWFYCGDGAVYGLRGKDVILYLTNFANNPLMKDPKTAAAQLINNENFFVDPSTAEDLEAKAASGNGVVAFNLSELPLQGDHPEYRHIEVSTSTLAKGRDAFKKQYGDKVTALVDRVHGPLIYGENGIGASLSKEGISNTRIYVLNPEHVKSALTKREGAMVARVSRLDDLDDLSDVDLYDRFLDNHGFVRGVADVTAEGGAQKIVDTYKAGKIKEALSLMDDATARLFQEIGTAYLSQQK